MKCRKSPIPAIHSAGPGHEAVVFSPQPAADYLQVAVPEDLLPADFSLRDGMGRVVLRQQIRHSDQTIPLKNLASGVYFVQLIIKAGKTISKTLQITQP